MRDFEKTQRKQRNTETGPESEIVAARSLRYDEMVAKIASDLLYSMIFPVAGRRTWEIKSRERHFQLVSAVSHSTR